MTDTSWAGLISLLALSALWALPAAAQEEEPDRWQAEAGLTLQASGGNESLTAFTTTAGLTHLETDRYEASLNGRLRYGESDGTKVVHNLRSDASFDLWPDATWSPFLFATAEQDPIKRLEARLNGGVGAKRTFYQDGFNEFSLSGAILYSYENLAVADSLGDGITQTARWSWRARGRKQLTETSRVEQVVFYQPAFNDFDDYQIEATTELRVALNDRLAITTSILYQRDNTPAPDVKPDDYSISVGLTAATQW